MTTGSRVSHHVTTFTSSTHSSPAKLQILFARVFNNLTFESTLFVKSSSCLPVPLKVHLPYFWLAKNLLKTAWKYITSDSRKIKFKKKNIAIANNVKERVWENKNKHFDFFSNWETPLRDGLVRAKQALSLKNTWEAPTRHVLKTKVGQPRLGLLVLPAFFNLLKAFCC